MVNRPVWVPALLELVNDAQVSGLCEVEMSEGEAGTPRYGVVGSVWDSVFQWVFSVISERMGRMTWKGVLCARRQVSSQPLSTSVLHRSKQFLPLPS